MPEDQKSTKPSTSDPIAEELSTAQSAEGPAGVSDVLGGSGERGSVAQQPKKRRASEPSMAPTELGHQQDIQKKASSMAGEGEPASSRKPTTPSTEALISDSGESTPSPRPADEDGSPEGDPHADPLVGRVLADRYEIHHRIGEGGMGVVYKAMHVGLKKEVAVKVLLPELGAISAVIKRFEREAQSMSRLDHPGVVRVTDFGRTEEGLLYLVMEYVEGESLGDLLAQLGRLSVKRALRLAQLVLLALDHAHELGVVHRDLKPDNIMVINAGSERESIKILDFGIAKILEEGGEDGKPLTVAGTVFGTPEYLSPEQAVGEPADFRADIYTVGIILYELITGQRPFEAENRMEIIAKHISAKPKPVTTALPMPSLPKELDDAVLHALEKSPEGRYQTAMEFYTALSSLPLDQRPLTSWPSPSQPMQLSKKDLKRLKRAGKSRSRFFLWVALILVLLGAGGGAAYYFFHSTDEHGEKKPQLTSAADERIGELPPALAKKVRTARAHLKAVRPKKALKLLDGLEEKYPKEPVVHYLMGRALVMRNHEKAGMKKYAEAIELDESFKKDQRLQQDIFETLESKSRSDRKAALDLLDDGLGKAGSPIIARVFKKNENYQTLRSVLVVAEKHGLGAVVDRRRFYEMMLRDAPLCSEREEAVKQLMLLGEKKALPALRRAITRKPWYYNRRKRSNECIHDTLREAIGRLEGDEKPDDADAGSGEGGEGEQGGDDKGEPRKEG
jgi:serine/threonine-protein kinase